MLMLGSYHIAHFDNYNNFNPGLVLQCNVVEAGAYYNSKRHMAEFVAYRGDWWTIGVVHGYNKHKLMPAGTVYRDFGPIEVNAAPFIETMNGKFRDVAVVINTAIRWEPR